ncbi:hypothetical protein MKEN_01123700 [Mycena kentingensis (nom. inval.)]|nr:hypothetical protein MKEN_01123700 [Mycena kentingensis (nom. inval.)]
MRAVYVDGSHGRSSGSRIRRTRRAFLLPRVDGDFQSQTLNSSLVVPAFAQSGLATGGVTASLTSTNNFINFCDTVPDLPITNGKQLDSDSCNPAPIGEVPPLDKLPTVRIFDPAQNDILTANTTFSLSFTAKGLHAGIFTNPNENFLAAPQQVAFDGVLGHYSLVIQQIEPNSTAPLDPRDFAYFSVLGDVPAEVDDKTGAGTIQTKIASGLPEGYYRATVSPHAANFQPVMGPTAQVAAFTDVLYFSVTATGRPRSVPSSSSRRRREWRDASVSRRGPLPALLRARADAQGSLTLVPSVVADGFLNNGMGTTFQAGQSSSATSPNNFINLCGSSSLPLIAGAGQAGFCNPAPMGLLPASSKMPSARVTYPRNGDMLRTNQPFLLGVGVLNLAAGNNANSGANYMSAPQQLSAEGLIKGHPYVVIENVVAGDRAAADAKFFVLFKGMTELADAEGVVTTEVSGGLVAGFYKLTVGIKTTNGMQVLLPKMQVGAVGDSIFFTVADDGPMPTNATGIVGTARTFSPPSSSLSISSAKPTGTQAQATDTAKSATQSNTVPVVAGAISGFTALALIILAIWFWRRRRRTAHSRDQMLQWRPGTFDTHHTPAPTPFTDRLQPNRSNTRTTGGSSSNAPYGSRERDFDARSDDSVTVIMPVSASASSSSPPRKMHAGMSPPPTTLATRMDSSATSSERRYSGMSAAPSYHTNVPYR